MKCSQLMEDLGEAKAVLERWVDELDVATIETYRMQVDQMTERHGQLSSRWQLYAAASALAALLFPAPPGNVIRLEAGDVLNWEGPLGAGSPVRVPVILHAADHSQEVVGVGIVTRVEGGLEVALNVRPWCPVPAEQVAAWVAREGIDVGFGFQAMKSTYDGEVRVIHLAKLLEVSLARP